MPARAILPSSLTELSLDRAGGVPLQQQLYRQLRGMILSGHIAPGRRLPPTRELARGLGVARNTVLDAFERLRAEGYLAARVGAGTFVAAELPDRLLAVHAPSASPARQAVPGGASHASRPSRLSRRGAALAALLPPRGARGQPFLPGVPALDAFPFDLWARLVAASWRGRAPALAAAGYGGGDPNGYPPLRRAIADYLRAARAVRADAEQVFVVSGAQQAIGLAATLLLDEGAPALVEDPGYPGVRGALRAAGAALVPVPVDGEGMAIAAGERRAPDARLACVAPSHQYPLGVTMSLARRLALLDWAARHDGWVIEDDYDSEYRYAGRPLTALQGLDQSERVIYVGSFSKTLFPALRLGYLVVPPALVAPLRKARLAIDGPPAALAQPALARFMAEGHFAAHLRRMRRLYAARQEALLAAAARHLGGLLEVQSVAAGMHLVAAPAAGLACDDRTASARAAAAGIDAPALSSFHVADAPLERRVQGLLLGFAAVPEDRIDAAVQRLAAALQ